MTLIQAMTTRYPTVAPDAALRDAARTMAEHHVVFLPVVSDGLLSGMLEVDSVLASLLGAARDDSVRVADVMIADPMTCAPADALPAVRDHLCARRVTGACVTAGDGRFVGVAELVHVADALREPQAFDGPLPEEVERVRGG